MTQRSCSEVIKLAKSRYWSAVLYPESMTVSFEELEEVITESGQEAICILHDKDTDPDGNLKKPHFHWIFIWSGPTTYKCCVEKYKPFGFVFAPEYRAQIVSLRGSARYLRHLDHPHKYQYDREAVKCFGGVDYDEIVTSASDALMVLSEIYDFIDAKQVIYFRRLVMFARAQRPDWYRVLSNQYRENVIAYCRSLEYELRETLSPEEYKALATASTREEYY